MNIIKIISTDIDNINNKSELTFKVPESGFSVESLKKYYLEKNGHIPNKRDRVELVEIDGVDQVDVLLKRRHKDILYFDDLIKYLKSQMDCNKRSRDKYMKENKDRYKSMVIKFTKDTESDLLNYLDSKQNKAGYIKALIRADMEK